MSTRKSYGKFFQLLREKEKLSQEELAKELKLSLSTIRGIEEESIFPEIDIIKKISEYFKVSFIEIVNGHKGTSKKDCDEFNENLRYYTAKYYPSIEERKKNYLKRKRLKNIAKSVTAILIIVAFIIFLHWFNENRDLGYELSGSSESFKIDHTLFLRDNGHYLLIMIGPKITNENISKEDITYSKLSSGDRLIVATNDLFTGELTEPKGYDEYFPKEVVDNLGNWTYNITYKVGEETKTETIVLSSKEI